MFKWKQYHRLGLQRLLLQERVASEGERLAKTLGRPLLREEEERLTRRLEAREEALDLWAPWRFTALVVAVLLGVLTWLFVRDAAPLPAVVCAGGAVYALILAAKAQRDVMRERRGRNLERDIPVE